jgi:hypothetical protein
MNLDNYSDEEIKYIFKICSKQNLSFKRKDLRSKKKYNQILIYFNFSPKHIFEAVDQRYTAIIRKEKIKMILEDL